MDAKAKRDGCNGEDGIEKIAGQTSQAKKSKILRPSSPPPRNNILDDAGHNRDGDEGKSLQGIN